MRCARQSASTMAFTTAGQEPITGSLDAQRIVLARNVARLEADGGHFERILSPQSAAGQIIWSEPAAYYDSRLRRPGLIRGRWRVIAAASTPLHGAERTNRERS